MGLRPLIILILVCVSLASQQREDADDLNQEPVKKHLLYAPNGRNFVRNTINLENGTVSFNQGGDDGDDSPSGGVKGYRSGKKKRKSWRGKYWEEQPAKRNILLPYYPSDDEGPKDDAEHRPADQMNYRSGNTEKAKRSDEPFNLEAPMFRHRP